MTGAELVERYGRRAAIGATSHAEALEMRKQLQRLDLCVRVVQRKLGGNHRAAISSWRVAWWPKPE
ncbi:hypothetical protein [Rhizobium phage RHph_X3_2]|nr:hypothetical protein [Rhizobium phage RHph_X3_2]